MHTHVYSLVTPCTPLNWRLEGGSDVTAEMREKMGGEEGSERGGREREEREREHIKSAVKQHCSYLNCVCESFPLVAPGT